MGITTMGRFFSLVAFVVAGGSLWTTNSRWAVLYWRLVAASGELAFFWTPWSRIGASLFVVGAGATVYHMSREKYWPTHSPRRQDAIELIELIAWLWMLIALR